MKKKRMKIEEEKDRERKRKEKMYLKKAPRIKQFKCSPCDMSFPDKVGNYCLSIITIMNRPCLAYNYETYTMILIW